MRGPSTMPKGTRLAALLLLTTSLTFPAALYAQEAPPQESASASASARVAAAAKRRSRIMPPR